MRKPSDAFIGTLVGLGIVLLVPSMYVNSAQDGLVWLTLFPGLGAIIGTVVTWNRRRQSKTR